jgi:hypothetical protein
MINLEFAKNMKETSNELLGKLKEEVKKSYNRNYEDNENYLDNVSFSFENKEYILEFYNDDWIDEGKYQFRNEFYFLTTSSYETHNIMISLPVIRTGSYYSCYEYQYEEPSYNKIKIKEIPEQIIPAHETVMNEEV